MYTVIQQSCVQRGADAFHVDGKEDFSPDRKKLHSFCLTPLICVGGMYFQSGKQLTARV